MESRYQQMKTQTCIHQACIVAITAVHVSTDMTGSLSQSQAVANCNIGSLGRCKPVVCQTIPATSIDFPFSHVCGLHQIKDRPALMSADQLTQ
jgi:hypothetical protein